MIPTDTTTGHKFTPSWRADEDKAPAYYMRGASVIERGQIEAELSGEYGAGRVYAFEVAQACQDGIETLMAEDPARDMLLELLERERTDKPIAAPEQQLLVEARAVLLKYWPHYRELVAQQERRREIAPIVIFRRLCIGWENVDATYERGPDRLVTESALAQISPLEMTAAGNFGYGLLYSAASERNFPQPSPSGEAPPTSNPDTSSEGGSLAPSSGKKTRASRSRNGSSRS